MVCGQGEIDGRAAVVQGDDFTVRGGAADAAIWQKMVYAERLAHDLRLPLVRLVDGTGGGGSVKSLEQMGYTYVPFIPGMELAIANLARVPVVAAALGPVAGLGAARVVASHFSRDRARDGAAVRGRAAGGGGGDGRVARQGGARRLADADARGRGRQRGGRRGRRARRSSSASSPTCRRACGSCRRSSRAATRPTGARRRCSRSCRATRASPTTCARSSRRCFDLGSRVRARRAPRPLADLRAGAARRAPGRRARQRPQALRRRADRRRVGQARALHRAVRPVPPAGRQPRRPAGVRDRHRGRARGHDAPRRARAVRGPPGDGAVGVGARAQGLRRRGRRARRRARG